MGINIYKGAVESLGQKWSKGCYYEYSSMTMVDGFRVKRRFLVTEEMDDILQEVLQSGEKVKLHMTIMTQETKSGALLALERANGVLYALNPPIIPSALKFWRAVLFVFSLLTLAFGVGIITLWVWWMVKKQLAATYALRNHLESLQGAIRVDQDIK